MRRPGDPRQLARDAGIERGAGERRRRRDRGGRRDPRLRGAGREAQRRDGGEKEMTCGCFHNAIPGYFVLRYVHAAFARVPLRRAVIAYRQTTRFAAAWLHDKTYIARRGSPRRQIGKAT